MLFRSIKRFAMGVLKFQEGVFDKNNEAVGIGRDSTGEGRDRK